MKKIKTASGVFGGVVVALLFLIGCRSLPMAGTPLVDVSAQTETSPSTVTVDDVVSVGPGWITIHNQNDDGSPGAVVGYAPVKDGVSLNVVVRIDRSQAGTHLIAMLHKDAGIVGKYEFPGPDEPVVTADGKVVMESFDLTEPGSGSMY